MNDYMTTQWLKNNKITNCDNSENDSVVLARDRLSVDWAGNITRKPTARKLRVLDKAETVRKL